MKKTLVKKVYEWTGNCPKCGKEQKTGNESFKNTVDEICNQCKSEESIKQEYSFLIGSTITDIYGNEAGLKTIYLTQSDGKKCRIDGGQTDWNGDTEIEVSDCD